MAPVPLHGSGLAWSGSTSRVRFPGSQAPASGSGGEAQGRGSPGEILNRLLSAGLAADGAALETTVDYLLTGREAKVQRDQRLRNLLLESLPEELRDAVVFTLDALVRVHNLAQAHQKRTKARQA